MTKKHYQMIAEIIKKWSFPHSSNPWSTEYYIEKEILIFELGKIFKEDNPNFNSTKFLEACREN